MKDEPKAGAHRKIVGYKGVLIVADTGHTITNFKIGEQGGDY
jgi:hypothetical protein